MRLDLSLSQSLDRVINLVARDADGDRLDLTGLTGTAITWKLAQETTRDANNSAVLTYDLSDGIALTDPDQGEFSVTIDGADIATLASGYYRHECLATVNGVTYRPLRGLATIERDIE